jgi:hypothetical protein
MRDYYSHTDDAIVISLEGQWQFRKGEYPPKEAATEEYSTKGGSTEEYSAKGGSMEDAATEGGAAKGAFPEEEPNETVILPGTTDTNRKGVFNTSADLNGDVKELTQKLQRRYEYTGKAVYAKTVRIPADWEDKCIVLLLERTRETRVWINGTYAGWRNALGTAQAFDVTGLIVPGCENTIAIEVDNGNYSAGKWFSNGESGDWITNSHMATGETATNWNGIIGKIQLIAESPVFIKSISVSPQAFERKARIRVAVGSSIMTDGTVTVTFRGASRNHDEIRDPDGISVDFHANGPETFIEFDYFFGREAKLWSEFTPVLYRLSAGLSAENGRIKSCRTISFGLRDFRIGGKGKQFEINGLTTFLRGEANCNVFPVTGYCIMDKEGWTEFLLKLRAFGVNFLRFHSWCPPQAAFEAADELGMYMQPELYLFGFTGRDPFATYNTYAYMKEEGERILAAYANHPSFVMLSFGNEIAVKDVRKIDLYRHFQAIDPGRLYTEGTCSFFWDNAEGDRYIGDYRTAMATSVGTCREQFYYEANPPSTEFNFGRSISEMKKPFISHEIGQYQIYPDYDEIAKYEDTVFRPVNFEYFRDLLERKGMLGQYKDFHKASGQWAAILYREEVEAALRTPQFAGYQLLSFQDFPGQQTALVGFYDSFMDLKNIVKPEEFRRWNSETVLLASMPKYVWTNAENFAAEIKAANYSAGPLNGVVPFWSLKDGKGCTLSSGMLERVDIPQGGLMLLGEINAPLGNVAISQKLTLEIGIGNTPIHTSYFIWAYPEETDLSVPEGIYTARVYDEAAKKALAAGDRVLLLPEPSRLNTEKSVSSKFMTDFWSKAFHYYDKCDSYSLGLLIDPAHPALSGFPTDFHSNWQWYDLVKNSRSIILDGTEASFKPIVQTIDHPDRSFKLGNIFEAEVNGGRLLVCSFDLPALLKSRPEARQLYKSLLAYMDSDLFKPSQTLAEECLEALFVRQKEN